MTNRGPLKHNPFEGLGGLREELEIKDPDNQDKKDLRDDLQERYQNTLSGQREKIKELSGKDSDGLRFTSSISNIEDIGFIAPNVGDSIHAIINYKDSKGKYKHDTFSISEDSNGNFQLFGAGVARKDLGVSKLELFNDVLKKLEVVNFTFWKTYKQSIIEKGVSKTNVAGSKSEQTEFKSRVVDERKINFFQSHPDALFGFCEEASGLSGYQGVVFSNFVVLENPEYGNATYIIPIDPPLEEKEYGRHMSDDKAQQVLEMPWNKNLGKARSELQELVKQDPEKYKRIYHKREEEFDSWEGKLTLEIENLLDSNKSVAV